MSYRLIDGFGSTTALSAVFSDAAVIRAMLRFESALAAAQARLDMVPQSAAAAIANANEIDAASLAEEARSSASLAIPFVKALTERVLETDPDAAGFVHWGATSQDVLDTTLILLLREARQVLTEDHTRLERALRGLSDQHANTVMLARTLLQPAVPTTFGYKAAGWYGGVHRSWRGLSQAFNEALQLQFGGAAGTLAAYGARGPELAAELAKELALPEPSAPWHVHRDRLASLIAHCGVYAGSLTKIARDVSLLMQAEIAEASERGGGSSAMPNKRNPSGSVVALAAAARVPGLVAAFLASMPGTRAGYGRVAVGVAHCGGSDPGYRQHARRGRGCDRGAHRGRQPHAGQYRRNSRRSVRRKSGHAAGPANGADQSPSTRGRGHHVVFAVPLRMG